MMRPLIAVAALLICAAGSSAASAETIAITGARAYTLTGEPPVDNATIIVTDGRISRVGAALAVPAGARVVDARGRIVTPGLMTGAAQLGLVENAAQDETTAHSLASGPLGAAFDIQYALDANSLPIEQARADGVTRAMSFPGRSAVAPFSGIGALLTLNEGAGILDREKAAVFAVVGGASASAAGGSRSAQWILLRDALTEARDLGTPRARDPRDRLFGRLDLEALRPVLAGKTPLGIFAKRESDIRQAISLGRDFGIRIVVLDGAEAWRVAPLLAETRTPVVLDPLASLPMSYDELGARADNAALLRKAGVEIAFSVPGAGIYLSYNTGTALREAAGTAVANGLPYADALRALTTGPAQIWGIGDRYGTIEPGRDADLVIWDGDPLEVTTAPKHVFVRGREVSRITRQSRLLERYRPVEASRDRR